jgi:single-strand DNA-binding protein
MFESEFPLLFIANVWVFSARSSLCWLDEKEKRMKDMNKIFIMGRLGADPTPKETKTGVKMVTFPVATARWTKEGGEITQWHRVVAWGKQSEQCVTYLKKGRSVLVEGSIKTRKYPSKDGIERLSVEVHADDVTFLGSAPKREVGESPYEEGGAQALTETEIEKTEGSEEAALAS